MAVNFCGVAAFHVGQSGALSTLLNPEEMHTSLSSPLIHFGPNVRELRPGPSSALIQFGR